MSDTRAEAMLKELAAQRNALGDRAAHLAADNATLREENEALKKRLVELVKTAGTAGSDSQGIER